MASTKDIKTRIDPYVRQWLTINIPGHIFQEKSVPLGVEGTHKFDAVSDDGLIVAEILSNRPKTRTGNENTGAVRKAQNDVTYLKLLPANIKRVMVFTDEEFRDLIHRRTLRMGTQSIEMIVCVLPPNLQKILTEILDKASHEQRAAKEK